MLKNFDQKKVGVAVVVLVLVAGVFAFWVKQENANPGYSVIYMTTGEVYIGKLTTFPDLELKDAYILQIAKDTTDPNKNNFQLNPVSEALWAPQVMYINKKNVIFYGRLLATSKIAETLAAQKK